MLKVAANIQIFLPLRAPRDDRFALLDWGWRNLQKVGSAVCIHQEGRFPGGGPSYLSYGIAGFIFLDGR